MTKMGIKNTLLKYINSKGIGSYINEVNAEPTDISAIQTGATEKTLQTTGDYPIVVSDMSCQIRINAVPTALPKIYPLNRDGTRATSIGMAAPVDTTGIYLDLRNGMSSTVFWEIDMRS